MSLPSARRSLAALALVLVAATLGVAAPAPAQDPPAPTPITEGSLTWGLKASWRAYVASGDGGLVDVAGGATADATGILTFPVTGGSYDAATGETQVDLAGSVRYRKYPLAGSTPPPGYEGSLDGHVLDLTMAEPHLTISDGVQELTFLVQSRDPATWEVVDYGRVAMAQLAIASVTPTVADGTTTWAGVPATLPQQAADEVLFHQYRPGAAIDPVTLRYQGPGGAPSLTEHWDEPGSTRLGPPTTSAPWTDGVQSAWLIDSRRQVVHYTTAHHDGTAFTYTIRAFDLATMATVGEGLSFPPGTFVPNIAFFDSTTGRIFVAGSSGGVTSSIRWDPVALRYEVTPATVPLLGRALAMWDPVGERAVNLERRVPTGVDTRAYDLHQWYLNTYTEGDEGTWVAESFPIPNGPAGLNQNWYRATAGGGTPSWAVATDGSLIVTRQRVNAATGTTAPATVPIQRFVIGDDAVTVTGIPGTESANVTGGLWSTVVAGPAGQVTMALGYTPTAPAAVQDIQVDGDATAAVGSPVTLGEMQVAAENVAVDPVDGTVWVVGSRTKDLAAVGDGRVLARQHFAELHADRPQVVVGPDHSVYAQVQQGEDVSTYGFGRFPRLGWSPAITTQPEDREVTLGVGQATADVTFTAAGTGTPEPTVRWQSAPAGATRFTDIAGEAGPTLTVAATVADDGRRFRAVASNPAGALATEAAILTVRAAPAVLLQPVDVAVVEGGDATFHVEAVGNPQPEVQWQRYSGGFWVDLDEADDAFLTIPDTNLDQSGTRLRARLRNDVATVVSQTATLTVTERVDEPRAVVGGDLDWGVRASFRSYIQGPIADGDVAVSGGATVDDDGTFRFPADDGTVTGDDVDAAFAGAVRFTGHHDALDLTLRDLRLELDGDEGALVADVASRGLDDGAITTYDDITFAELDLTGVAVTPVEGGIRLADVPATLTEDGSEAFADFYEAGAALDPLTATLLLGDVPPPARTATASFVTAALTDLLGREPTGPEVHAGVAALDGGVLRATWLRSLVRSDAWLGGVVDGLYEATLGRPADATGRAFWIERLRTGGWSVARVAAQLHASDERYAAAGGTDPAWVDALYRSILGREPDAAGRAHWVAQVAVVGRGGVALRLHQSGESARARVRALYVDLLGRAADAPGLAHWAPRVVREGDLALAVHLVASAEYRARAVARFP